MPGRAELLMKAYVCSGQLQLWASFWVHLCLVLPRAELIPSDCSHSCTRPSLLPPAPLPLHHLQEVTAAVPALSLVPLRG